MAASPVRLSPLFFVFLIQLLVLVGCGGGNSTSTTAQAAKPVGYFRKTDGATAKSAIAKTTTNTTVNMSYARIGHTETLLADGRVLIAGGNNSPINNPNHNIPTGTNPNFTTYNNAELFDPATELFSLVPSTMSSQRTEQCAVILPDKRVLMISGNDEYVIDPDLSLVDIFDPTTNTFSSQHVAGYQLLSAGPGPEDKLHCFLLPGERVFIFGGSTTAGGSTAWAAPAVLDLTTWTVRPITLVGDPLLYERYYESATQAFDGRVFVVGGVTAHYIATNYSRASADVLAFDPITETMQVIGQLQTARASAGILPMDDGSVEVYGGAYWSADGITAQRISSVERISPTGSSTAIGDLAAVKLVYFPVLLQSGLSLHAGGAGADGITNSDEILFDESTYQSWFTGKMVEERSDYGIQMLGTGRVLITGGEDSFAQASDTGEIYEPASEFYITLPNPVLALGESVQLTPQPSISVTWSAKVGTVNASGLYTAPDVTRWRAEGTPPFDDVTATASDGTRATARIPLLAQ